MKGKDNVGKLTGEIYFQLRHLTGRVKHEIIVGEVDEEIYENKIYKVHFPTRQSAISIHGKVFAKQGKRIFDASAKLEPRGDTTILTLIDDMKESSQRPIIDIYKIVTATVTPFSSLPQFEVEMKLEKYDLIIYTASLTSDKNLLFVGDFVGFNGIQLEVVDVYGSNLKLKEVG